MTAERMGTLAWAKATGGRLSKTEKVALARNFASLRAEMMFDEARHRLGLLKPAEFELDSLAPPDTKLVRDADEFARSHYNDLLWNHCLRTYYFGVQVAAFDGIKFDRELFYAAAICHDVGLDEAAAGSVATCCFACSGGKLTCEHLSQKGHGAAADRVGEAISTHINLFVPPDQYPAESTLLAIGAMCDIFGAYARRIAPSTLAATVERAPRMDLSQAFGPLLSKPHLKDSRTALQLQMGVFESNAADLIDAILTSYRPSRTHS